MSPTARTFRLALAAAAAAALLAAPARAQQMGATPALRSAMSDLRNLVTAQEAYFAENNRYADDLTKAKFIPTTGNTVRLVNPEANGWGAELRSAGIEGSCVIYVNLPGPRRPRTTVEKKVYDEGEPSCDGDGETEAVHLAAAAVFRTTQVLAYLAKLQEQRFGKTGAYASDVSELEGWRANPGVTVTITVTPAGARLPGYYAAATHVNYPGVNCIVRSGWGPWGRQAATAKQQRRPNGDLQVACDSFID